MSHVRSLRSNVRKARKISYSLYPLYSSLWFEQLKKISQNCKKWLSIAIFGHFVYSKAKWLQKGRLWKRSSHQQTRWLMPPHVKETATSKCRDYCHVFTWPYKIHFIPTNMVRTGVRDNLRMCKQNTKTSDVVPQRQTKRFHQRFWPVDRFCELSFRYLSSPTGREGGRER